MGTKAHEYGGHQTDEDFLHVITGELGRRDFVNKKPSCEEQANGQQNERQMGENGWVDWAHIASHGLNANL